MARARVEQQQPAATGTTLIVAVGLGIAFELVKDPKPADRLPPKGARDVTNSRRNTVELYLGLGKK